MVNLNAGLIPVDRTFHDLGALIQECGEKTKKSFSNYQWKLSIESLPLIPFDKDLIELLFYNLAYHSIEFAPPDSTIEIFVRQAGEYAEMSIMSAGLTIPQEVFDVAFEKAYRIPGSTNTGLGLGLAIVKTIMRIHKGELKVKPRPEGGMIFSIFLPIV